MVIWASYPWRTAKFTLTVDPPPICQNAPPYGPPLELAIAASTPEPTELSYLPAHTIVQG